MARHRDQSVFVYVVARDFGFAPNPFHGFCTLACCKPKIRSAAEVGDWVFGMAGGDLSAPGNCIFGMSGNSRMICKREKKVGSHRVTNICITAGERRRQRDRIHEANDRFHRGQRGGDSLFCNVGGWC